MSSEQIKTLDGTKSASHKCVVDHLSVYAVKEGSGYTAYIQSGLTDMTGEVVYRPTLLWPTELIRLVAKNVGSN